MCIIDFSLYLSVLFLVLRFVFKQKTAYEMRISDWSSDVCSSDLMSHQPPLALSFPLRGSQLIEASAGTGKTFTISALYLRLVLGHGGPATGFGDRKRVA